MDSTNARIGVGDSSTAASRTQLNLQASTNKTYKAMDSGFPTVYGTYDEQWQLQSSFGAAEANYAWNEWIICTPTSPPNWMLNRKVVSLGTKSGGTWTFTVTLSLT
jgi:hypothetical protein